MRKSVGRAPSLRVYDKRQLVTTEFKSGGLHEKHVEATWKGGNHLSIRSWSQGNQEKPVSR
jgi:hypothetical protein